MTITEAIKQVMLDHCGPMSVAEVYQAIIVANLYQFHSDNPVQIVRNQIRRHCEGLDFPSSAPAKLFKIEDKNTYFVCHIEKQPNNKSMTTQKNIAENCSTKKTSTTLEELLKLHVRYISELKSKILSDLKQLSPSAFEAFAKRLLDVYGFHDTRVTQVSNDGGIDGYGKLKVGLASLNVAYQCKRWTKGNIQRPEVDKFRGAIQGDYEQGIFFTTTSFSEGAIDVSMKRGAVPVILVDGDAIVELMIAKGFGVQLENISLPSYALDLAFDVSS